jgi:hypothetical protein
MFAFIIILVPTLWHSQNSRIIAVEEWLWEVCLRNLCSSHAGGLSCYRRFTFRLQRAATAVVLLNGKGVLLEEAKEAFELQETLTAVIEYERVEYFSTLARKRKLHWHPSAHKESQHQKYLHP